MTKRMQKALRWLAKNRKRLQKEDRRWFEFPEYAGMPKSLSSKLSYDEEDTIQELWDDFLGYGPYGKKLSKNVMSMRTIRRNLRMFYDAN